MSDKERVKTKITAYFETNLRIAAAQNSLIPKCDDRGLDWAPPPSSIKLNYNIRCEIVKITLEISFFSGNYLTA